jgi:hypothetical protein
MTNFSDKRLWLSTTVILAALGTAAMAAAPNAGPGPGQPDRCARLTERLSQLDRNLSAEQVRDIFAGRLAEAGEPNLIVGKVTPKGEGVVTMEIVTRQGGSLVATQDISLKTGLNAGIEERCRTTQARLTNAPNGRPGRAARMRGARGMGGMPAMRGGGMSGLGSLAILGGQRDGDLDLSEADVRKLAEAALVLSDNDRLKVGTIRAKDADTYSVEIVTSDNAVALTSEVDRHTGRMRRGS